MSTVRPVPTYEQSSDGAADRVTTGPVPVEGLMSAIVQTGYGTDEVLQLDQVARPQIADNEVLVEVKAAGLDRGTWHMMAGRPYLMRVIGFGLSRPKNPVPGIDVAGVVAVVGSSVTRFRIGDEVFGIAKGSFAQHAAALEDKLALKPKSLTFEQAAVVPVSAITALQGLTDVGHLQSGQRVLVIGASGGVGSYAVQIAKAMGAAVTGVASTAKLDLVRSLGADHVVDYTREDYADGTQAYDLVLDIGGNPPLSRLRAALAPCGTAVIVGGEQGGNVTGGFGRSLRAPLVSLFVKQRLAMLTTKERGSDLERLTTMLEAGTVKPSIDRTYPLAQVPAAMRHLVAGHVRGKVAITL